MNVFICIVSVLAAIAGLVMPWILQARESNRKFYDETPKKVNRKPWTVLTVLAVMCFLFGLSFKIVPTGYTGVRTTFGQISQETVPNGFCFKIPFVENIHLVNNKQQDVKLEAQVWGESKEKTPVYASEITVTFQINPTKAAWIYANISDPDLLITQDIVSSASKSAMVELSVEDVTNRAKIEPLVKEKLVTSINEKYGDDTLTIMKVVINQMDFEPAYNEAINQKSLAKQQQERQEIENQTAMAKAEADKKIAMTNAEAAAEAKRIAAEAEAKAMLIKAEAEAEANKKIAESLTGEVIDNKVIEKWDGKLPVVSGDGDEIIDIGPVIKN